MRVFLFLAAVALLALSLIRLSLSLPPQVRSKGISVYGTAAATSASTEETGAESMKRILVDLSEQRTYAYEGESVRYTFVSSSGRPGSETVAGQYSIQNKISSAYSYAYGMELPHWMGIYWAGDLENGFHGPPVADDGTVLWESALGTPISYGCVVLGTADMATLFHWAEVGTVVVIQP